MNGVTQIFFEQKPALDNGIFYITYSSVATIVIDIVTLLFLFGMISCTYAYRKRGRLSDRFFFMMIIINMVMTVADALSQIFLYSYYDFADIIFVICAGSLSILATVLCYLLIMYFICFLPSGEQKVKKHYKKLAIPSLITLVFIVLYHAGRLSIDTDLGMSLVTIMSYLQNFGVAVYALMGIAVVWKVNKKAIFAFALPFAAKYVIEYFYLTINSWVYVFTIVLAFSLIEEMNHSFHREEEECSK